MSGVRRLPSLIALLLATLCACTAPVKQTGAASAAPTQADTRQSGGSAVPSTRPGRDPTSGLRWIAARDLPREAGPVLDRIAQGGPFRSARDGVTFANREHVLPGAPRGTYREYTVPTPGSSDRGARRIVCAGAPRSTAECYYTADHYATFRRIQP
ncbi:ribonuclease [Deinococcus sp. KSM4-11]|nr:ribonuclease domain-containing protein [Deinococcus sp. KSM4-11]THF89051.1 ribonuclease [Deinococcus sp. KSM4-11]